MICFSYVSVMNLENAIRGMRMPLNSHAKSDSYYDCGSFIMGSNDFELAMKLIKSGSDHSKFMRQIGISMDITAPLYFWSEYDTYKVGTVANSTSFMHTGMSKPFNMEQFAYDDWAVIGLRNAIIDMNILRDEWLTAEGKVKELIWRAILQIRPSSWLQTRTCTLNYAVARNMYQARKNHKLSEWREFCEELKQLPYSEFIII